MRLNESALNVPRVVRLEPFEESRRLLVGHGASARFGALWRVRPQQRVRREHFSLDGVVEHGLRGRVVIRPRPRLTRRTRPSQAPPSPSAPSWQRSRRRRRWPSIRRWSSWRTPAAAGDAWWQAQSRKRSWRRPGARQTRVTRPASFGGVPCFRLPALDYRRASGVRPIALSRVRPAR